MKKTEMIFLYRMFQAFHQTGDEHKQSLGKKNHSRLRESNAYKIGDEKHELTRCKIAMEGVKG